MELMLVDLDRAPFESNGQDIELPVGMYDILIPKRELVREAIGRLNNVELIAGRKPMITETRHAIKIRFEVVGTP